MNKEYQGIDLESMRIVNDKNDVEFVFCHRYGENNDVVYRKKLLCENIYSIEMFMGAIDNEEPNMPYYLLEISVNEIDLAIRKHESDFIKRNISRLSKEKCCFIQMMGDIEINLVCEKAIETND